MVLKVGSIRDFFLPYSKPKDKPTSAQNGGDNAAALTRDDNQAGLCPSTEVETNKLKSTHVQASADHVSTSPARKIAASIEQTTPKPAFTRQGSSRDRSESPLTPVPSHLSSPLTLLSPRQRQHISSGKDPLPSQISYTSTSSRRTVVDGVQAVTNTDSEPSLTSDDDLPDPDRFIPRKKRKVTPEPPTASPVGSRANAIPLDDDSDTLVIAPKKRVSKKVRELPKTTYRLSLKDIAKEFGQEQANETRRKDAEALVEKLQAAPVTSTSIVEAAADLASDDEDRERLKSALARMDATSTQDVFYFFHGTSTPAPPSWPVQSGALSILNDADDRREMLLSGMLAEMASRVRVPQSLITYLCQALLYEQDEALCLSYLRVLRNIDKSEFSFMHASCSLSSLYRGQTRLEGSLSGRASLPASLKSGLAFIQVLAPSITSIQQLSTLLFELFLLNIDQHVQNDIALRFHITKTFDSVFQSKAAQDAVPAVIDDILNQEVLTPIQCCKAINAIDASSTGVHLFRRQLAVHYILGVDADELIDVNSADTGTRLLVKLKNDRSFSGGDDTDWLLFHERMQVVDVAIDVGFSSFTFIGEVSPQQSGKRSPAETDFNKQIDALTRQLQIITNGIRDSGTSHLRRTEAKHALGTTVSRLQHCVRTQPVPTNSIFDSAGEQTIERFWT